MLRLFISIASLFMLAYSQVSNGSIKGQVIDKATKDVLVGVNVSLLGTKKGTVTDENGRYELRNLKVASYRLKFEYLGYKSYIKPDVIVKPSRSTKADIALSEDLYSGETVTVTADYYQSTIAEPIRVVSFSPEEIRRSPGSGGELSRILGAMPSVSGRGEDSQDIMVRGGSPIENFFLVDNIPVPSIRHFETATGHSNGPIGLINTALVKDVKFSAGGYEAKYGSYLSSVTDIRYKDGNRDEFNGAIGMDFTGFNLLLEGPATSSASYFISARRSYLDLVADAIGEPGAPRFEDVQGKFSYHLSDQSKLEFLAIWGKSSFDARDLEKAKDNEANNLLYAENQQYTLGLNWSQFWKKTLFSQTSFSLSKRFFEFSMENFFKQKLTNNDDRYNYINFRHESTFVLSKRTRLSLAFDLRKEDADFNYFFAKDTLATGAIRQELRLKQEKSLVTGGLSTSLISSLSNKLNLQIGLRADYNSFNENAILEPRFNLSYQLNDISSLNAAFGIVHQSIPLFIASQINSASSLKSMKASHYVLSYDRLITADTKATLEGFYKKYEDMPLNPNAANIAPIYPLDTRFGQSFEKIESIGEGESYGVEFLLQKKLALDFYGMISTSFFRSLYSDQFGSTQNRDFDNQFLFNVIGGYKPNDTWEFSLRWSMIGGKPYTPIDEAASKLAGREVLDMSRYNQERLPAYHSLYLRADYRVSYQESNMLYYFTVWNAYKNENINQYFWNEEKEKIVKDTGFSLLPVMGIKYEF